MATCSEGASLRLARAGVADLACLGLTGELDVQGNPWYPAAWWAGSSGLTSWVGGDWMGATWTGSDRAATSDGLESNCWSSARWSSARWSAASWG